MRYSTEQHNTCLRRVLSLRSTRRCTVNTKKCVQGQSQVDFKSHLILANGVRPLSNDVDEIRKIHVPQSAAELKPFLATAAYLLKFVPNIATIVEPLRALLRNTTDRSPTKASETNLSTAECLLNPVHPNGNGRLTVKKGSQLLGNAFCVLLYLHVFTSNVKLSLPVFRLALVLARVYHKFRIMRNARSHLHRVCYLLLSAITLALKRKLLRVCGLRRNFTSTWRAANSRCALTIRLCALFVPLKELVVVVHCDCIGDSTALSLNGLRRRKVTRRLECTSWRKSASANRWSIQHRPSFDSERQNDSTTFSWPHASSQTWHERTAP